ncbi:MAG TPA: GTP 3',8-cyclase MoaA [Planctomycetota bacterium]|nr:GTP 3',8-cyclase MoaA [Planctomycetota bacterium]
MDSLPVLADRLGRPLGNLRISVTDRCNLRCAYCMPEEEYAWLPQPSLLRFEELAQLARIFASLGVDRIRLTGGEPLLRRDLPVLIAMLAEVPGIEDLALTTNGILLEAQAEALANAGLKRLTVSLDTLQPARFRELSRRDGLDAVLAGIARAKKAGFENLKLDTVVLRGTNDDELDALLDYAKSVGAELRFIEYMDVGGATRWTKQAVVSRREILERLAKSRGAIEPIVEESSAPADRYRLADGTVFGVISSTTQPFCGSCDRARLTADGRWFLCLYAREGLDLGKALRAGATTKELAALIRSRWSARDDQGAVARLAEHERAALAAIEELRRDPHLEMHTRGG